MSSTNSKIVAINFLLIVSNSWAGPANYVSYRYKSIEPKAVDNWEIPLIFDSRELEEVRRHYRAPIINNNYQRYYKNSGNIKYQELHKSEEAIAFRPLRPSGSRTYNRRPSSAKASNVLQTIQNPNDLWNQMEERDTDGKTNDFQDKEPKAALSVEILPTPRDNSSDDEESQDILFNDFFTHMKSTSPKPTRRPTKKTFIAQANNNANKDPVISTDQGLEGRDEISFLSLDSAIKQRACGSNSSVKDGKCRSTATFS